MKKMTKKERVNAALRGEPVDRIPVSFWRHFYEREDTPRGLADAMLLFQQNYDWDFMKVNPRGGYHFEDWGAKFRFFKDGLTKPERLDNPVKKINDLAKIHPLEPMKSPILRDHVDALHYISKEIDKDVHFLMTVFSPISVVADMAPSRDKFGEYLLEDPKLVHSAIEAVTQTFEKFITEILNVGISGLFYATTHWGHYGRMTDESFDEFSRPYDMRLLKLVQDHPFNILHVCKGNNMLRALADYPVHAFNWDAADPTNLNLAEGREAVGKTVIGGIGHKSPMSEGTKSECLKEADDALKSLGTKGWMLGAGCTFEPSAPSENLKALREWVEKVAVK